MTVYLCRRPLSLLSVVHTNIPLRLRLRNAIRQSTIYRRSIAVRAPLLPVKATEGVEALLPLRPQCCSAEAAVVPMRNAIHQSIIHRRSIAASVPRFPAKATKKAGALLLLRPQCCADPAAVVPLRNAIHQSIIHRRSIAASIPLLPAKATEGAGALLLLQPQCCIVAAAVVSHERFRTMTMTTASVLLYKCHVLNIKFVQIYLVQCVLDGSFDRLSLHFVFFSLKKTLSACLSIFSTSIDRVALSAPSACYAVLVIYCFSTVSVAAEPKGLASLLQRYRVSGFRAGDQTLTP